MKYAAVTSIPKINAVEYSKGNRTIHNSPQAEHATYDESGASFACCFLFRQTAECALLCFSKRGILKAEKDEMRKLFVRGGID